MLVVTVLFEILSEKIEEFKPAILCNAALSLQTESDCHQFDVCFSLDGHQCFLYEVYSDQAAFALHLKTPHYHEFNRLTEAMVMNKIVSRYELLFNPLTQTK